MQQNTPALASIIVRHRFLKFLRIVSNVGQGLCTDTAEMVPHPHAISDWTRPHRTPTPRFVRWDSGLPIRCDLLVRSLLPSGCERSHMTSPTPCSEVFDYIEGFYNCVRRHKHLDQLSPHEFERQRQTAL